MKLTYLIPAIAAMMLMSSCSVVHKAESKFSDITSSVASVFTPSKNKEKKTETTTTEKNTTTKQATATSKPAATSAGKSVNKAMAASKAKPGTVKPPKNKNNKKNTTPKSDNAVQSGKLPTTEQLLGGQWNITAVGETMIEAEDNAPYITFAADGRFYAGDGCNVLNGSYLLRSDGQMSFSSVLSTMKFCPDVAFATAVGDALADGKTYTVDCNKIGQETYLYLKNAKGHTAVTLRRHNMEFLNGNWQVTSIEGEPVDDEEANLFIDIAELKIHGNTGCNYFNGSLYIDPSRSNAIDFSNMALTRMACPKVDQERSMMVALEQTVTAIAGSNDNTVLLLDGAGKQVMTLKRIPYQKNEE